MDKPDGRWITWNGKHIFVKEGSSVAKAIGQRIKAFRKKKAAQKQEYLNDLDKRISAKEKEASNYFTESGLHKRSSVNEDLYEKGMKADEERQDLLDHKKAVEKSNKQKITGRAKTKEEYDRYFKQKNELLESLPNGPEYAKQYNYAKEYQKQYKSGKDLQSKSYKLKGVDKVKISGYKDYSNYFDKTSAMRKADEKYNNEIRKINSSTRGAIAERAKGISPGNKGKRTDIARQEWNKADRRKAAAEAERKKAYTFKRKK